MLEFEEQKLKLLGYKPELLDLADALGLKALQAEVERLEEQSAQPNFWDDVENSHKILQRISQGKNKINTYETLKQKFDDALTLIELADEENDESLVDEVVQNVNEVIQEIEELRLTTLLSGEYDANNAILTFHAGAGGTEAQDWVQMLHRMYIRYAERKGFKARTIDFLDGEEAGLKSATVVVEGENAYGYLKSEAGVHRLVRVSPFDASGRRQTSFASLEIVPEIDDTITVDINPDDIRIDTYRSSGAGGQKVNKTSSAIRITHLPTGIVVCCQNERSQHQNKDMAMKMLMSKLVEIKEREHLEKIDDIKGEQKQIGWGSQIRSYVFMPYTLVKDNRTNFEMGNINAVMDGDLDGFINAYLTALSQGKI